MKRLLVATYAIVSFTFSYGLEVGINTKCEGLRDNVFTPDPEVHNSCIIDDLMQKYINCREYYNTNVINGLDSNGEKKVDLGTNLKGEGGYSALDNYNFFDKEIKKVLEAEVKKEIDSGQGIMCIENSEASLMRYQESIAKHEWCYAPNFLKAFNDDPPMNEHEMKYGYFNKLYRVRANKLVSKEKPKKKSILCGVYLECMSSFIQANHTEVSNKLESLYEKTKKECISSYYTIVTNTEYRRVTKKHRPRGAAILGPKILINSYISTKQSKQVFYINPKGGVMKIVAIKEDAKSRYEGQRYRFDKKSCMFVNKRSKTKIDKSLESSLAKVVKHNIFNTESNGAFIEIKVSNNNFRKKFKVPWNVLKNDGSWSGRGAKNKYDAPSSAEQQLMNSEMYKRIFSTGRAMTNSDILKKNNEVARQIGISKDQMCTMFSAEFLIGAFSKVENSFDAKIKVNITPASKQDIEEFKLYASIAGVHTIRARKIEISKFEKEADGIFGNLENSIYDSLDDDKKDAWNKAYKEAKKEEQNKKDTEEFDNMSIDDLEMFSN